MNNYNRYIKIIVAVLLLAVSTGMRAEQSNMRKLAFAWGAEIGSNVDLSQHGMTSLGINAKAGISWRWLRFFGVGAEGNIMVTNSGRNYPLFVNFRTDFSSSDQLMFLDLRGGVSLNYLYDDQSTAPYFSGGIGIKLAKGKSFTSHIILAYTYLGQDVCYKGLQARTCPGISMASLRLGITFGTGGSSSQTAKAVPEVITSPYYTTPSTPSPEQKTTTPAEQPKATAPAQQPTEQPKATAPAQQPTEQPKATAPAQQPTEQPKATAPAQQPTEQPKATVPAQQPTEQPKATAPTQQPAEQPKATAPAQQPTEQPKATAPAQQPTEQPKAATPAPKPQPRAVPTQNKPEKNVEVPNFINKGANNIILPPGADRDKWKKLARDITNAKKQGEQINILHIGDSHIQAEMGTSRMRRLLQDKYGNGGRGLISAYKLAGTNQPVDYQITSQYPMDEQVRLLKRPWAIKPGFTGVASSSKRSNQITFRNLNPEYRFNRARIFTSDGESRIALAELADSAQFYLLPGEKIYGIYTSNTNAPGIIYSTIGNNGACFSDYLTIDGFAEDAAKLQPRLIILSMGTNEGFSDMTPQEIRETTVQLINNLRQTNPNALMMIWTPMECHKKDDNGNFAVNPKVKVARDILMEVAQKEGIAIWDFYTVSGGDAAAQQWIDRELMNPRDHVHLLNKGYRLQGELAADALMKFIKKMK